MDRNEILNMTAGREMDALIHKEVMGFVWPDDRCLVCGWPYQPEHCQPNDCSMRPVPTPRADEPPYYSTDISAAWEVVEKLSEMSAYVEVTLYNCGHNSCKLHPFKDIYVEAETAPLAICRAALLAVMEI